MDVLRTVNLLQTFDHFLIVALDATLCFMVFVSHDQEKWLWAHAIVLTRALPFGNEAWSQRVIRSKCCSDTRKVVRTSL